MLAAEGCTELRLVESEVVDAALGSRPNAKLLGAKLNITASDRLKHYNKPTKGYIGALLEGVRNSIWLVISMVGVIVVCAWQRQYLAAASAGLAVVMWLAFILCVAMPGILYRRLHKAGDWHQWDEVDDLVTKLESLRLVHFIKVPAPELGRWRAKVLAASGRLSEAVLQYQQFEDAPGCPKWLHKLFLAGLCDLAKEHDAALKYTLESISEKPTPTAYRDLANRYLRYKGDPANARLALAEAEKELMLELAKPFDLRCRGILALLERDYPDARGRLESAIELMEQTRNVPFRDGHISVAKAYLCRALAEVGELERARKCLEEARPYLVATGESELLRECDDAVSQGC